MAIERGKTLRRRSSWTMPRSGINMGPASSAASGRGVGAELAEAAKEWASFM